MEKKILFEAPDISVHNGNVNFKAIRDAGYKQVFLRAGYGRNNVDQRYVVNAEACRNLGIPAITYWFSYALSKAMSSNEADYAIVQTEKYWDCCPIAFDLEYDTIRYAATKGVCIDKTLATDMAIEFLRRVKKAGHVPVLYLNRDYKINYFDMERIQREVGDVKIWYARYSNSISAAELGDTDIWQYTSKGRISGVAGNVDINKVYTDLFSDISSAPRQPSQCNLYIQSFQRATNADGYLDDTGSRLVEDGIDGNRTQAVRKKVNLKARLLIFVGSTGELVKWWQGRLNETLGINLSVDGKFGKDTRLATMEFQKRFGLAVDGIAGYNTIQRAFYI